MSVFYDAIYNRAVNSAAITNRLSKKPDGSPSIYDVVPVPGSAETPYLVIRPPSADQNNTDESSKQREARSHQRRLTWYDDVSETRTDIEELGETIRDQFHNQKLTIPGTDWDFYKATTTNPVDAPTTRDEIRGMRLTVTLTAQEAV